MCGLLETGTELRTFSRIDSTSFEYFCTRERSRNETSQKNVGEQDGGERERRTKFRKRRYGQRAPSSYLARTSQQVFLVSNDPTSRERTWIGTHDANISKGRVLRLEFGLELVQALRARTALAFAVLVLTRSIALTPLPVSVKTSLSEPASA